MTPALLGMCGTLVIPEGQFLGFRMISAEVGPVVWSDVLALGLDPAAANDRLHSAARLVY